MTDKALVLYHAQCRDGQAAAYIAVSALRKQGYTVEHAPCAYGDSEWQKHSIDGCHVYFVDFSEPNNEILEICSRAASVTVLDHHLSAKQALSSFLPSPTPFRAIPLGGDDGGIAYVDEADYAKVQGYSWYAAVHGGAIAYIGGGRADPTMAYMHRLILDAPEGTLIDHWNRDTLDNRRINLRVATKKQNGANMRRGSGYKGVTLSKGKWRAQISCDYENHYLGTFDTAEAAARAYDVAALERFGDFAALNFDSRPMPGPANLKVVFDTNRCGARIAYDHFDGEAQKVPLTLINFIQDRDLWTWKLDGSKRVSAWISTFGDGLDSFAAMIDEYNYLGLAGVVAAGGAVIDYQKQVVDKHLKNVEVYNLLGHKVAVTNATTMISEICHEALALHPEADFALSWQDLVKEKKRVFSLRSRKDGVDVSEVAKKLGGGGHASAAGFSVEMPWLDVGAWK